MEKWSAGVRMSCMRNAWHRRPVVRAAGESPPSLHSLLFFPHSLIIAERFNISPDKRILVCSQHAAAHPSNLSLQSHCTRLLGSGTERDASEIQFLPLVSFMTFRTTFAGDPCNRCGPHILPPLTTSPNLSEPDISVAIKS